MKVKEKLDEEVSEIAKQREEMIQVYRELKD